MAFPKKLTAEQIQAIRAWAAIGTNLTRVAERFKVSHQTVRRAIRPGKREYANG